ncbi:MAG: hypothetical protein AAGI51_07745 [Pseudomonadota bacterium]
MSKAEVGEAAGIEALIARLREEGVDEGRAEAGRLVQEAERRAREILEAAEAEAARTRESARAEAERFRRGGEEALNTAMRDAVLELKTRLGHGFAEQIRGMVSDLASDDEVLKRMIVAVAGRAREDAGVDSAAALEIALPRSVVGLEQLRREPESLAEGTLSHFAAAVAADMLRAGVRFSRAEDDAGGIRVVLEDRDLVIDLTDEAVAGLILQHLQPRFRALLEGVVG